MITFLSGGTGTPKLLQGARNILDDTEISVIVNTGEDIWYQGGHISPDVDTVMYLFAGILNTDSWWGIKDDTFTTDKILKKAFPDYYMSIGDQDRAIQILRAELLGKGMSLTSITQELSRFFSVKGNILPMSDSPWTTYVKTPKGELHFQEYWVKYRGNCGISAIFHKPEEFPLATPKVISAIRSSKAVIIGPSNPVTSIFPILSCAGVKEELEKKKVIAISPFIGDNPVSGPAAELMKIMGYSADSQGVSDIYGDIVNFFIQDTRDTIKIDGSILCDTLMKSPEIAEDLMRKILSTI
ncbi:MAG: 2-phospho-L-lactate transferase [Methanomicrobiales archaeon]|nr:2-phospho-L-lactate transferase [Methanomicrobiales archaeon]